MSLIGYNHQHMDPIIVCRFPFADSSKEMAINEERVHTLPSLSYLSLFLTFFLIPFSHNFPALSPIPLCQVIFATNIAIMFVTYLVYSAIAPFFPDEASVGLRVRKGECADIFTSLCACERENMLFYNFDTHTQDCGLDSFLIGIVMAAFPLGTFFSSLAVGPLSPFSSSLSLSHFLASVSYLSSLSHFRCRPSTHWAEKAHATRVHSCLPLILSCTHLSSLSFSPYHSSEWDRPCL